MNGEVEMEAVGPSLGQPKAVVLLSGGIDSSTCLAAARREGFVPLALTFDYGQRHRHELRAARRVAAALEASEHLVLRIPLEQIGGSALTDELPVPKDNSLGGIGGQIPITYVPARNTIFLSFALAWGEVQGTGDLFIGVNALDYSGYPDCRPEYIEAFERLANLATKEAVEGRTPIRVHTPLIGLTKAGIIRLGRELGVDFRLTHSCYDPDESGRACGRCESCLLRKKGFQEAGVTDPTEYSSR